MVSRMTPTLDSYLTPRDAPPKTNNHQQKTNTAQRVLLQLTPIFFSWLITILAIVNEIFKTRYSTYKKDNLRKFKLSILPFFL